MVRASSHAHGPRTSERIINRRLLGIALGLAVIIAVVACTPRDVAQNDCLGGSRPIVDVGPGHVNPYPGFPASLPNNTAMDARGETFDNSTLDAQGRSNAVKFHFIEGSRDNLCFVGGTISTSLDPENTPWATWHSIIGMQVLVPNLKVVGTTFRNEGDLVSFQVTATNWSLIGIRSDGGGAAPSGYIHDDCIENDFMNSGLVDDAKLDGCTVFLSAISGGPTPVDGHLNTVEVRNSLVRLQGYHNSFDTPKYGFDRHGGFFKWASNPVTDGVAPQLHVHDSVFRADTPGVYGGNSNGFLGLPSGTNCHDVTLINTSAWPAGDLASWQNQCTNITYGSTADWDTAVATWEADHPPM